MRERESKLLGVEKEDKESEGSDGLIEQESHGNKGKGTVEEKPSRMEVPPAGVPQIGGPRWFPSLPQEVDGDGGG